MGDVIHKTAAVADIVADGRESHTRALARGGDFAALADEHLKNALAIFDLINGRWAAAAKALGPLQAKLDHIDDVADRLIGRISDEIWNATGRRANDPILALLFPGGITYYTDGPDAEQPARMELLADLLESGLHPRIDAKKAKEYARELRGSAKEHRAAYDAMAPQQTQAEMFGRMRVAVARTVQMALSSYKRHLKALGHTEAQIHSIIPDRPRAKKEPAPAPSPAP